MRKTWLAPLILLCAGSALDAQTSSTTVNAASNARVNVENLTGATTVVGWDRNEVQTMATGSAARQVKIQSDGRRVSIEAPGHVALIVHVPRQALLTVESASGPVQIRGVENTIEVEAASGAINIEAVARSITATGFSGSVIIRGGGTEITRAESASGSVTVTDAQGLLDLSSSSGSVVARGRVRDAKLFSVSGSVSFDGTIDNGGRLLLETSSGSVSLRLPANTAAQYELSTVNGHIQNAFGPRVDPSGHGDDKRLRFAVGSGRARIKASTVSGSVHLSSR